jgi:uncharacterized protein DUF4426
MQIIQKIGSPIALLAALMLSPRFGHGAQVQDFGDYIIHYSAISTNQLMPEMAKSYGIERSDKRGFLNIAVQAKSTGESHMVNAEVSAQVSDLTGHSAPIQIRETSENGDIDYIGEFPLSGSGTYIFTVKVTPPNHAQAYVVKFNQEYVVD